MDEDQDPPTQRQSIRFIVRKTCTANTPATLFYRTVHTNKITEEKKAGVLRAV